MEGFTLVEIMAVIFIMAVMIGMVSIAVGGVPERRLAMEAQRLHQKLRLLMDHAEFSGVECGIGFTESGYEFYRFDEAGLSWKLIEGETEFQPVKLEAGYTLAFTRTETEIEINTEILLAADESDKVVDYGEREKEPEIIFFSDGQLTNFEIVIGNRGLPKITYVVTGESPSRIAFSKNEK